MPNGRPEIVRESLQVIEEEADNLTDLIDNLLEVSRVQAGTFNLEISDEVMLPRLAEMTVRKFSSQTSNHTFFVNFPTDFPTVYGDERRLTQVLNNLVSNAIKYAPEGGQITIGGAVHPQHVTVFVKDTGIGIPAHEQHRIFQQFFAPGQRPQPQNRGDGLGAVFVEGDY